MGTNLPSIKKKFANLVEEVQPMAMSQFIVWLDEKVAEFKVNGFMHLDTLRDAPKWIKNYSMSMLILGSTTEEDPPDNSASHPPETEQPSRLASASKSPRRESTDRHAPLAQVKREKPDDSDDDDDLVCLGGTDPIPQPIGSHHRGSISVASTSRSTEFSPHFKSRNFPSIPRSSNLKFSPPRVPFRGLHPTQQSSFIPGISSTNPSETITFPNIDSLNQPSSDSLSMPSFGDSFTNSGQDMDGTVKMEDSQSVISEEQGYDDGSGDYDAQYDPNMMSGIPGMAGPSTSQGANDNVLLSEVALRRRKKATYNRQWLARMKSDPTRQSHWELIKILAVMVSQGTCTRTPDTPNL